MIFLSRTDDRPENLDQTRRHPGHRRLRRAASKRTGVAVLTGAVVLAACAAGAPVAGAAPPVGCSANADGSVTCSYSSTGAEQKFTVPTGVTALSVQAVGAPGGEGLDYPLTTPGGLAAVVQSVIPATPGQSLYVEVGGTASGSTGGYNGGANGGQNAGGGGGATDIRTCSATATSCSGADNTLDSRLVVAGGGGGGGTTGDGGGSTGGNAGSTASAGANGTGDVAAPGFGGGGGTSTGGGSAGQAGAGGVGPAQNGTAGSGGAGGNDPNTPGGAPYGGGGGGGAGYFGGGGGGGADIHVTVRPNGYSIVPGAAGGGGAGSSYAVPTNSSEIATATQGQSPSVSITYTPASPSISSISPATLGRGASGIPVTVTGSDFAPPEKVKVTGPNGGVTATVKSSAATAVTLAVSVGQAAALGQYTITLTGADGQVATCSGCLTTVAGPDITGFMPSQLAPGAKTTFTATGSGFSSDAKLTGPKGVALLGAEGVKRWDNHHRHDHRRGDRSGRYVPARHGQERAAGQLRQQRGPWTEHQLTPNASPARNRPGVTPGLFRCPVPGPPPLGRNSPLEPLADGLPPRRRFIDVDHQDGLRLVPEHANAGAAILDRVGLRAARVPRSVLAS